MQKAIILKLKHGLPWTSIFGIVPKIVTPFIPCACNTVLQLNRAGSDSPYTYICLSSMGTKHSISSRDAFQKNKTTGKHKESFQQTNIYFRSVTHGQTESSGAALRLLWAAGASDPGRTWRSRVLSVRGWNASQRAMASSLCEPDLELSLYLAC